MQESWPACGGSTSVGTTPRAPAAEKSRSRASGASNTSSCGEDQPGRRRSPATVIQCPTSNGQGATRMPARTQSVTPPAVAAHASTQVSSNPSNGDDDGIHTSSQRQMAPAGIPTGAI